MSEIIHVSDTHGGKKIGLPWRRTSLSDVSRELIDVIHERHPNAFVIHTGDVGEHPDDLDEQAAIWGRLKNKKAKIPGNHDRKRGGFLGFREPGQEFEQFLRETGHSYSTFPCAVDVDANTRLILIDSNIPPVRLARGHVGYDQLIKVAQFLEQAQRAGKRTIVALHHHPWQHNSTLVVEDWESLLSTLSARCDLLLFGHDHTAGAWSDVYGVRRAYAADATTRSRRYRVIWWDDATQRFEARWESF